MPDLRSLLDTRPIVVVVAGPNGAGKSTFFDAHLAESGLYFVNADVLANSIGIDAYAAAELADKLRKQLVERGESFIFETVFSDPVGEKVAFLKSAQQAGYTVFLMFIGIANPGISEDRVAMRVASGGHDVPRQKLFERYRRSLKNLKLAFTGLDNVWVYDHSDLSSGYRLVALRDQRHAVRLIAPVPAWLRPLLP